jgi:hypothetical protein
MTLMKFSPSLSSRGITLAEDDGPFRPEESSPVPVPAAAAGDRGTRGLLHDLEEIRARTRELAALAI